MPTSYRAELDALCLMGPTAAGKTALAIDLAARFPCELVSVDSAQIYRGMDIGTGKPDAATLARAPHHLLDILDPVQAYSAADFRRDALRLIAEIKSRGNLPVLVGGTMLYFRVLRDGLAAMPNADPQVRAVIEEQARTQGWAAVHAELAAVDAPAAARIHPNDPQRLQRALEVYRVSGKTLTELHAEEAEQRDATQADAPRLAFCAIQPRERSVLHSKIEARFLQMLDAGLVDEVRALKQRSDLSLALPSMRSVGYKQIWQFLEGETDYQEMVDRSIIATRQLAKRQLTWLRGWGVLDCLPESREESLHRLLKIATSATTNSV